jgi:hypothetical protein
MDFRMHDCECSHPRGMCPPTVQHPTSYNTKWYSDCMLVKCSCPRGMSPSRYGYNTMSVYSYPMIFRLLTFISFWYLRCINIDYDRLSARPIILQIGFIHQHSRRTSTLHVHNGAQEWVSGCWCCWNWSSRFRRICVTTFTPFVVRWFERCIQIRRTIKSNQITSHHTFPLAPPCWLTSHSRVVPRRSCTLDVCMHCVSGLMSTIFPTFLDCFFLFLGKRRNVLHYLHLREWVLF